MISAAKFFSILPYISTSLYCLLPSPFHTPWYLSWCLLKSVETFPCAAVAVHAFVGRGRCVHADVRLWAL